MVMYGVLLIAVLVITGGVIAFIGDRVGSKIGKKRLSIFGLRPRHTSIVITIITGICITTLTFGVMATVSKNVRTALFGMDRLNREMQEANSHLQTVSAALQEAQEEKEKTNDILQQVRDKVSDMQSEQSALEEHSRELYEGNMLLEQAKQELMGKNEVLLSANEGLMNQNDSLAETNKHLSLDKENLEKSTLELKEGMQAIREGDIVYRAGEVVASGVIAGSRDVEDVRRDLASLALVANRNVAQRLGSNVDEGSMLFYPPEFEQAAVFIAQSPQDVVVRIVAAGNQIRGEAVRTILQLYKNSTIYKDKEFIIARPFKLHGNQGEAEQDVMSFLQDVNQAAADRGVLPDPISGAVGVMDGAQFYDTVKTLIPISGTAIISAYAHGDTDALGPLRLYMRVDAGQ